MTISELSCLIGIAIPTLRVWTCRRQIPHIKIGTRVMFQQSAIEAWLQSKTVTPAILNKQTVERLATKRLGRPLKVGKDRHIDALVASVKAEVL